MASDSSSETSFLEQVISSRNRDLSSLLPFIFGFSNSPRTEPSDPNQETEQINDRIVLINPFTQGMIVIEGNRSLDALLREVSNKEGPPPASKASIDAMTKVLITEEDRDGECSICLDGWEEIGGEVREMPCEHRFHSNCIEKWLGIHGSCPICRFKMPFDEDECKKRNEEERERGRRGEREIWVSFSFSGNNRRTSTESDSSSNPPQEDVGFVDESSNN